MSHRQQKAFEREVKDEVTRKVAKVNCSRLNDTSLISF
jgi:hypothetical protein